MVPSISLTSALASEGSWSAPFSPPTSATSQVGIQGSVPFHMPPAGFGGCLPAALSTPPAVAATSSDSPPPAEPDKGGGQRGLGSLGGPPPLSGTAANAQMTAMALGEMLKQQGITTVMIRNVPPGVTQKRLLEELDRSGFIGLYDFCYMPSTFGTGVTKGYAFVNFVSPDVVATFVSAWHHSRRFGMNFGETVLNVSAATLQGRELNVRKWDAPRMRRVRNPALRPLVLGHWDREPERSTTPKDTGTDPRSEDDAADEAAGR